MEIVRCGIENSPSQSERGDFTAIRTSRCHELQFKLVLLGAFANQSLYERRQVGDQQQYFQTRGTHANGQPQDSGPSARFWYRETILFPQPHHPLDVRRELESSAEQGFIRIAW